MSGMPFSDDIRSQVRDFGAGRVIALLIFGVFIIATGLWWLVTAT